MCIFGEAQPHVVFLVSCAEDQDSKPKVPMAPAHFIQKRRFLRRWRFEELLQQDLKNGIVLAACMRGAGHHSEGLVYRCMQRVKIFAQNGRENIGKFFVVKRYVASMFRC